MPKRRNTRLPLTIAAIAFASAGLLIGCTNDTDAEPPHVSVETTVAPTTPPSVPAWYAKMWGKMTPKGQEFVCHMWTDGDSDAHADIVNAAAGKVDPITYDEAEQWLAFNCSAWKDGTTGNPQPHDHNDGTHDH